MDEWDIESEAVQEALDNHDEATCLEIVAALVPDDVDISRLDEGAAVDVLAMMVENI